MFKIAIQNFTCHRIPDVKPTKHKLWWWDYSDEIAPFDADVQI